ncbi:hypothetical protein GCM10010182_67210 [Actinomadura cremea]|nr:hypothetical protein GCM10010182_67210 [Actinomadura cremea]
MSARDEYIKGLRDLADFIESHPELPLPTGSSVGPYVTGTDEEERAEVDRIATILGVTASGDTHYIASRSFGPVTYEAIAIAADHMARYDALMSYRNVVEPTTGGAR